MSHRRLLLSSLALISTLGTGCKDEPAPGDDGLDATGVDAATDAATDAASCPAPVPLFLNRSAGTYQVGATTDAATNTIKFTDREAVVAPTQYDDTQWREVVACVRAAVAPFNVEVVETEPASGGYAEVAVGHRYWGTNAQFMTMVAEATCTPPPRPVIFVFTGADSSGAPAATCKDAVAGWAMATAKLDWVLRPPAGRDYLTWDGNAAPSWIDEPLACGEQTARACRCGGTTQHAYASLLAAYGPACTD
ncbi:MAG TPA: hypothetical protein VM734_02555 [Kofleriaceae bacterium]|nr:hypothetical protein [Kofleriaceae bacterium]